MELKGRVALITGASRGIGAAIAEELARRGANLFITWTPSPGSAESAASVMRRIAALNLNTEVHGIAVDFNHPSGPAAVVSECTKHFPHIDILVNNAAVELMQPIAATTMDDFDRVMNVNLKAPFFLVQAVLPHLHAPARIVNVSSIVARSGFAPGPVYAASKAGLEAMTRCMARAFGKDGTTVNSVAPGLVRTDMAERAFPAEAFEEDAAMTPVEQRNGTTDDIAQVVAWLVGDGAKWISGQCVNASGGMTMA